RRCTHAGRCRAQGNPPTAQAENTMTAATTHDVAAALRQAVRCIPAGASTCRHAAIVPLR
ncbi:hypothetical protein, partial [Rhodanobacter sp. OR444]|uniref:hypothetical protein n=1 Tax=Rhodanobacter sp. OR444 TaxID=1076525 RepID=UPI001C83C98A